MVVLLTHILCPRKKHISHLTSAARLACSFYSRTDDTSTDVCYYMALHTSMSYWARFEITKHYLCTCTRHKVFACVITNIFVVTLFVLLG